MDVRQIALCDGIGNIIQSIPFIKQMRTMCDKLTAFNRADFPESSILVENLFDEILPHTHTGKVYSIPPLQNYKHTPEYKSWFLYHNIPEPLEYKISYEDVNFKKVSDQVDFVLWGGCKPNWLTKKWPYWYKLAKLLLADGYTVGVVGLPEEGGEFPENVIDYRGKLSLTQTGGLIHNALSYVGNEGGITHYANALGSKMWVIWGGTSPGKNTPPPRFGYQSISLNLNCQPCQYRLPGPKGCGVYDCLNGLSAETVYNTIIENII